ncbi:MAG: stage II sporulation protein M [Lachnospiraceae bacterium]|nr:stage II sporulation protein M [Lachnospiraceae bacterium]
MIHHNEKTKSQIRKTGFLQKILLLFLIGFFFGALVYYIFQNSFSGLMEQMEQNMIGWSGEGYEMSNGFLQSLWNHGKYFFLLWLLSVSPVFLLYQSAFTVYTGIRNGFLVMFFIFGRGLRGIFLYFASLFPHCIVFLILYLFCFAWIRESKKTDSQPKHKGFVYIAVTLVFLAACLLECKGNLPLMETLL